MPKVEMAQPAHFSFLQTMASTDTSGRRSGGGRGRGKGRGGGRNGSRRPRHRSDNQQQRKKEENKNEDGAGASAAAAAASQPDARATRSRQRKKKGKSNKDTAVTATEQPDAPAAGHQSQNQNQSNNDKRKKKVKEQFAPHLPLDEALRLYAEEPTKYIRGKFRVSGSAGQRIKAFVSCDRGGFRRDVIISGVADTNRALDGDTVFVEILGPVEEASGEDDKKDDADSVADQLAELAVDDNEGEDNDDEDMEFEDYDVKEDDDDDDDDEEEDIPTWRQDTMQRSLWNPAIDTRRFWI